MNRKLLNKFLRSSDRFSFYLGEYCFPKFMQSGPNKYFSLEDNRKQNLEQADSAWSRYFKSILQCYSGLYYIREFPLIIERRNRWENYCLANMALDNESLNRKYFLADYFFPDYNLLVEIDSDLHIQEYDKARDEYIQEIWGLKTLRFNEFGCSPENQSYYIREFNKVIECGKTNRVSMVYNSLLVDYFNYKLGSIKQNIDAVERIINTNRLTERVLDLTSYGKVFGNFMDFKDLQYVILGMYDILVISKAYNP